MKETTDTHTDMVMGIVQSRAPNMKVKPLYQPIVAEYTALNNTLPVNTDVTPNSDESANTEPETMTTSGKVIPAILNMKKNPEFLTKIVLGEPDCYIISIFQGLG